MDCYITACIANGSTIGFVYQFFNSGSYVAESFYLWTPSAGQKYDDGVQLALAAAQAYATANSYSVSNYNFPQANADWSISLSTNEKFINNKPTIPTSLPMYVSGVAKSNYYAVVGSPTVAGGAGVARFYVDTNGDGTGTAPSAIFTPSLQAVIWNTSAVYIPESISVDTNRKYIDITMGKQSFGTTILSLITVLTGSSIGAAANGTTVNCFVLVQQ